MAEEKKEEIIVKAPSRPVTTPEEKARKNAERALEEERYGVLAIPKKVGKYLGVASLATGIMLVIMLSYATVSGQIAQMFSSTSVQFIVLWVFVGLITITIGLLLMGSE